MNIKLLLIACTTLASTLTGVGGTPNIEFNQTVYDFGKVSGTETVAGKFVFKNTGDGLLTLQKPVTTCGCTLADLKTSSLKPGEETELGFTLNLGKTRSQVQKYIRVLSDDPDSPEVQLTIKADYTPLYDLAPNTVNVALRQGADTNITVRIKRTDGQKLDSLSVKSTKDWIVAKTQSGASASDAELILAIKPEGAGRRFAEQVQILGSDNAPIATVSVLGRIITDVAVTPEMLYWNITDPNRFRDNPNEAVARRRLLVNSTVPDQKLEVRNATSSLKEVTVEVGPSVNGRYEVTAKLAEVPESSLKGTVTFETNIPGQAKVEVPITINVVKR
jgi:hypothetical protein